MKPILRRRIALLLALLLTITLLMACTSRVDVPVPTVEGEAPLIAESRLNGTLTAWPDAAPMPNRGVALCLLHGSDPHLGCDIQPQSATTDAQGSFTITGLPAGTYLLLIQSGRGDFQRAVASEPLALAEVRPADWSWIAANLLGLADNLGSPIADPLTTRVNLLAPASLPADARMQYALAAFAFEGSPYFIAHTLTEMTARPVMLEIGSGSLSATISTVIPQPPDSAALRASLAPLTRDEARLLDPALVSRWDAFMNGDDSAYSDGDAALIAAVRSGAVYQIGDTYLTRVDVFGSSLVKSVGYMVFDHQTGAPTLIGLLDLTTSDIREISSGYLLNVRDNPGEWLVAGPNGEQFYHFGWSYYQVWRRILPDPVIAVAESFRTVGASNVTRYLDAYREAAANYPDGDLTLLPWDATTAQSAMQWAPRPDAPPYVSVPDSGTVDVRRERFYEAVTSGAVIVDEASVVRFLQGDVARNGFFYTPDLTAQNVIDALLAPYRAGHLYTDFEAAMILDATYGGEGPLVIRVTGQMPDGAFVPRDEKQLFFADGEVADVILGYSGTLLARWPHEMGHILDFRDPRNDYPRVRRGTGSSRCEPLKYMMEYMWWVERFPYDAPDWDWQPVGSGLTLARLLTATYPNSGC